MSPKPIAVILSLSGIVGIVDCHVAPRPGDIGGPPTKQWPRQAAGRDLQVVADNYAIYAVSQEAAEELRAWVDAELVELRARYPDLPIQPGAVLAIEPGDEPVPGAEQWRQDNVNRRRQIVWSSPIRSQWISTGKGRPYSFFMEPYFRESFEMPWEEAVRLDLMEAVVPAPAWVCFLATEPHVTEEFNARLWQHRRECLASLSDVPWPVLLLNWWVPPVFQLVAECVFPKYRAIDVALMRLQRRETLWGTLITCAVTDESRRSSELAALQSEIDEAWEYLWVRRPIE